MTEEGLGKRLGPSMAYRQPAAAILEQPRKTANGCRDAPFDTR
jgi:hypothetical protein